MRHVPRSDPSAAAIIAQPAATAVSTYGLGLASPGRQGDAPALHLSGA